MLALPGPRSLWITVGVLAGALMVAAAPAPLSSARAQGAYLTGQLLIATDELKDPRFVRTVIFMIRHDAKGAMGLVLNRPLGDAPLATLLDQAGIDPKGAAGSVRLHVGGPVEPTRVFVMHGPDYAAPDTLRIGSEFAVTFHPDILQAIAEGRGPKRAVFTVGYAGWAPDQLETEIKGGYWFIATAEAGIVFDDAYTTKWDRAMARRRITL
jgi:putative transcriptional regulator